MTVSWQSALADVAPRLDVAAWSGPLADAFRVFQFNTPRRIAAALGQFLVEAGPAFSATSENLDYTSALRLAMIFPREIPDAVAAQPYVNNPVALGNLVYANRLGNGDVDSGDGYRFRGRGLIQITGRDLYTQLAGAVGVSLDTLPDWCATPGGAAMSGCWFLEMRGALPLADAWEISAITKAVNGPAMLGAEDRLDYANKILALTTS